MDHLFFKTASEALSVWQCLYRKTFLFWYPISYKKVRKSDYVWLQVTTDDCKWPRAPMSQNTGEKRDFWWLRVTIFDDRGQNTSDHKWLRVTITFDCHTCDHTWRANFILKIVILHYPSIITERVRLKIFRKFAEIRC